MSVLSRPRLYFTGFIEWDVNTCNNNKYWPQWIPESGELNWDYLGKLDPPVTRENFREQFPIWASKVDPKTKGKGQQEPAEQPGLWNYFGGNGCNFVNNGKKATRIIGGVLNDGTPITADPLINAPVSLVGNPFGGHSAASPGRLVDLSAMSTLTSQIYFDELAIGSPGVKIEGKREYRMHSRFINIARNLTYGLEAGGAAATWQTCIPNAQLTVSNTGDSKLLASFGEAMGNADGLMIRFCTYLTLYFQNGIFNDIEIRPRSFEDLKEPYEAAFKGTGPYFSNPAYSYVAGVIGVWNRNELATAPNDRILFSNTPVPPAGGGCPTPLGPVSARVEYDSGSVGRIVLDLGTTFPESNESGEKADLGSFEIGVSAGSSFTRLASLDFSQYNTAAYEKTSGIVELSPKAPVSKSVIESGSLEIRSGSIVASKEWVTASQTDQRAVYLDEGERATVSVGVRVRGEPPIDGKVLVVRYLQTAATAADEKKVNVIESGAPERYVMFPENSTIRLPVCTLNSQGEPVPISPAAFADVVAADCNANGNCSVTVEAANPGFPYLVFLPGEQLYVPPVISCFPGLLNGNFAAVRVMPFDEGIQQMFVEEWNKSYDPEAAWNFVYGRILYLYDMLYPVMSRYMPLGDRASVEAAVDQFIPLISQDYVTTESTLMMPITRDLSSAKRWVLEAWCKLVKGNYPPVPISGPAPRESSIS